MTATWRQSGNNFSILEEGISHKNLPANIYQANASMFGPYLSVMEPRTDELTKFSKGPVNKILNQIEQFCTSKGKYEKLKIPYKRGILMYGPPGTGKSGAIRSISEEIVKKEGIVLNINSFRLLKQYVELLSIHEKNRFIVYVLEDLDTLIDEDDEYTLLQVMDGLTNNSEGSIYLATTNNIEQLSTRLVRPSRFDILVSVDALCIDTRREFIRNMCGKSDIPYDENLAIHSEDMTLAEIKELVVSCHIYDEEPQIVKERIQLYKTLTQEE